MAITRTLAQYSGWPVPFDEYRLLSPNDPRQKLIDGSLRAATQGGETHKGTIASTTSTISTPPRTSPCVTGQNSPRDSATASRYTTVIMAKARRGKGNDAAFAATKTWCPHYYHLGRWIMERRAAFAKLTLTKLRVWLSSADVKKTFADGDDRTKLVYGVAHSAFTAIGEMLGMKQAQDEADKFREFTISYGARSMAQVREETFRNRFWTDVVNALASRKTGITPWFFSQAMVTFANPDGTLPNKNFLLTTEHLRGLCLDESKAVAIKPTNTHKHDQIHMRALRSFFSWCVETRRTAENPAKAVKLARVDQPARIRFCTKAERDMLIADAPTDDLRFILLMGFHCGMRKGEIIEARTGWFTGGTVFIENTDSFRIKDRDARHIPLTEPVKEFLAGYLAEKDRAAFALKPGVKHGRGTYRYDFHRPFNDYLLAKGMRWVTAHVMRHTFASLLVQAGVSIFKVARWLGDGVEVAEKHYAHLAPQDADIDRMV